MELPTGMLRVRVDAALRITLRERVPEQRGALRLGKALRSAPLRPLATFLEGMRTKSRLLPGLGTELWAKGSTNMCSGRMRSFCTPEGAR